jgi:hypothetical protein
LAVGDLRQEFANQSLTANTALALTHNLGKQLVHVSAMDGDGNKVELEITYTNANSVSVKSTVGLTGIDIAVPLNPIHLESLIWVAPFVFLLRSIDDDVEGG